MRIWCSLGWSMRGVWFLGGDVTTSKKLEALNAFFKLCCLKNLTLHSSSVPGHGDRDDAELLGHFFHWGGGWGSSRWPSLAAAVRVQGPSGDRGAGEASGESWIPRDLRHRGHPILGPAPCWCPQQIPAASAPQVPLLLGQVCPGQLLCGAVCVSCCAWAGVCFRPRLQYFHNYKLPHFD